MAISTRKTVDEIINAGLGGGGGGSIAVKDEGVIISAAAGSIDFVGPTVTAVDNSGNITVCFNSMDNAQSRLK